MTPDPLPLSPHGTPHPILDAVLHDNPLFDGSPPQRAIANLVILVDVPALAYYLADRVCSAEGQWTHLAAGVASQGLTPEYAGIQADLQLLGAVCDCSAYAILDRLAALAQGLNDAE